MTPRALVKVVWATAAIWIIIYVIGNRWISNTPTDVAIAPSSVAIAYESPAHVQPALEIASVPTIGVANTKDAPGLATNAPIPKVEIPITATVSRAIADLSASATTPPPVTASTQQISPLCRANMRAIVKAAQEWCFRNQTEFMPTDLMLLTNDLEDHLVLLCPADPLWHSKAVDTWQEFDPNSISYRVQASFYTRNREARLGVSIVYLGCPFHKHWEPGDSGLDRRRYHTERWLWPRTEQ